MSNLARVFLLAAAALAGGCAKGPGGLPYDAWYLGFLAPSYMDVWIESAVVMDTREQTFSESGGGLASIRNPPGLDVDPAGWSRYHGWGKGKHIRGAAMPRWIYVRWQSLVEPQTYEALIFIDDATRKAMVKPEKTFCDFDGKWITDYRDGIGIGLAPGGIARATISGQCLPDQVVARVQGQVVKLGPDQGRSGGEYALPPSPASQAYIKKHGIPYGSW